jgi:hypothetical protein
MPCFLDDEVLSLEILRYDRPEGRAKGFKTPGQVLSEGFIWIEVIHGVVSSVFF